ncbi:protein abnormal spindle [Venturia canescens]|uniref:protein abnormal spindle n=1 Tax=Venturia canescens TaxID=32260 RepID=UPI001C9CC66F|nr:protein abnormal spindle [Venturia canescens]
MFFQVNVTPKEKKPPKIREGNNKEKVEVRQEYELTLAPFQPQTRLNLESTVNNTVKCSLKVKNPSNRNLEVTVTKSPPVERSVILSASELSVSAGSEAELEISWTPKEGGSWRDTLQLTDSRRIKYDVAIILSAPIIGKKPNKGKVRVLAPSNTTNERALARNVSLPVAREPKKTVLSDKENVPKFRSTGKVVEVQHSTTFSRNKHNFSNIMNSTEFGFTPLKARDEGPNIRISSTTETSISPQKMSIVSSELATLPHEKGSVQTTHTCQQENHNFSIIMNSTTFNFTPLQARSDPGEENVPTGQMRIETKMSFSPQNISLVSPEAVGLPMLRRETYVTRKCVKSIGQTFTEETKDKQEEDENFPDSLSPQPEVEEENSDLRKPSDFSALIDDMKFLTPEGPNCGKNGNFSPNGCSTGNRTRSVEKLASHEASSLNLAGNDTFDLSNSKIENNSGANGTYELSPKSSKNLDTVRPPRLLSQSFELTSPNEQTVNHLSGSKISSIPFSSTPVCRNVLPGQFQSRTSISHTPYKNYDDVSVKQVLEADLWAKPENEQFTSSIASSSIKKRCISLNRINEEETSPDRVFFVPLNKTKTLTSVKNQERPTKFRRFEISPPKKCISALGTPDRTRRVSPTKSTKVRKDKKLSEPSTSFRKKVQKNCSIKHGQVSIPGVRIANLSLARLNQSNIKEKSTRNEPKEMSVQLHDPNDYLTRFCNPDPFAATTTQDPFLTSTLYYDDKWIYQQEMEFKKWLNKLLTPPEHLSADVDSIRVDVGKVWQSCRNREDVALAESRETVSARYHTNTRLNTLRKAACAMFRREEVTAALSKATVCVERGSLMIRQDRDLHRDIGLQKEILELFLSYNPLWLRIGLETVYGETIPLHSNNDLVGLTRFLISRFFSDPFIVKTHSHATILSLKLSTFSLHMNKFILKKFLLLVYFLDYAKRNKLIGHDPCLFHKRASHKDSRAILLTFAREVLSGVGDLTKVLRTHGYVVSHQQTYLDEYDYAVKEIATDLRDGVRLCRVMELITGDRNLTCRCRVPSISRLQKVYNVDLALAALLRCGYTITGEIDAKSIADGHREKTLSLLWQIIYKYQRPRFEKAANTIRRWWRANLWYVRVRNLLRDRRENAASTIQRAWKCHEARRIAEELREERKRRRTKEEEAIRVIQICWLRRMKMLRDRRDFILKRKAAISIQTWFRRHRESAPFVREFRVKRRAVEIIQNHWRSYLLARKERARYLYLLDSTRTIQSLWRAKQAGRKDLQRYVSLKKVTIVVQSRWRALRSMKTARQSFEQIIRSTIVIQSWWRRSLRLKRDRNEYLLKKHAVREIERWLIARKKMLFERDRFRARRQATILIQRNFRRYSQTKEFVEQFRKCARASRVIQHWYRSARIAKHYRTQKTSCVAIQRWWRAICLTRIAVRSFENLQKATIVIQKTWRMKRARRDYAQMKHAVETIEFWYERALLMRSARREFIAKRNAAAKLQSWWRNLQISRNQQSEYLKYRQNVIVIQTKWRATLIARKTRLEYLQTRKVIVQVQATWRMIRQRRIFVDLLGRHRAASLLQKRWRETAVAREVRKNFLEYRSACVLIQNRFRELRACRAARFDYTRIRRATIVIQKNWRMLRISREYKNQKDAAIILQERWRARKLCIEARKNYLELREATIRMQLRYKSNNKALETRRTYLELRSTVIIVQRMWRAKKSMEAARNRFGEFKRAAIVLQSNWRMILERRSYLKVRNAALTLQTRWRAVKLAGQVRESYENLRGSVLTVQRRFRANRACKVARNEYARTRSIIIRMQKLWRKKMDHRLRDEAAINIQTWWKSIIVMRECKKTYEDKKRIALVLQRRYRATKIASQVRKNYLRTLASIVKLQRRWRFLLKKKRHEAWLRERKTAVSTIENWWIIVLEEKRKRIAKFVQLQKEHAAATKIQSLWRGHSVRMNQSVAMKDLRERSERAATAAVPSATVAFKLRASMDTLDNCKTIAQLFVCLTNLDTLTRLSYEGCILFCKMNFANKVYGTIAMANRSIPWLDVCSRCTSILITLAKLPETKNYIHRIDQMETLARLMTVAIDHHVDLFLRLATLLWLLSENEEYATAVKNCSRTTWILRSLNVTINKKKGKFPAGNFNRLMVGEQTALLPNSKPDWGIKHNRPRLFTTVHHAISSLMKRLKIDAPI